MSDAKISFVRHDGFTVLPNDVVRNKDLSLKTKGLLLVMQSLPPEWDFTVSGLCSITGTGKDAIGASLRELEKCGYLTREQSHGEKGKFAGSVYVLDVYRSPLAGFPPTGNPSADLPSAGNPPQYKKDIIQERSNIPPISPTGEVVRKRKRKRDAPKAAPEWKPERFAGFWSYYPRGENKQEAIRAWDALRPSDELIDAMGEALVRQKATELWQRGVGIPYAATWLNQRRWEDEVRELPKADKPSGYWASDEEA